MKDKIKRIAIIVLTALFQFSFALVFTSSRILVIDNLLNQYTEMANEEKNSSNNYVHTEIMITNNTISNESTSFISSNVSRAKETVTYYSLFSKGFTNPVFTTSNYSSEPTILYNPYRYDFNNKYFESFRLRQVFSNIDSRIIDDGFDFTIQISNNEADQILEANNISGGYDYFINNKVEVYLNFNGTEYKGIITNLFYIEEEEPISTELNYYHGNYSIIIPKKQLRNDTISKLNHDFINNSMRIKKEMKKINESFAENKTQFFDGSENNLKITSLYQTLINKEAINIDILIPSLVGVIVSAAAVFFISRFGKDAKIYLSQSLPKDVFISVLLFSVIVYTLKRIFVSEFFYTLSNLYSGVLTISLLLFTSIYLFRKGRKKIINEK